MLQDLIQDMDQSQIHQVQHSDSMYTKQKIIQVSMECVHQDSLIVLQVDIIQIYWLKRIKMKDLWIGEIVNHKLDLYHHQVEGVWDQVIW